MAAELLNVNGTELLSGQVVNGKISGGAKNVIIIKEKYKLKDHQYCSVKDV